VRVRLRTLDLARRRRKSLSKAKKLDFDKKVVTLVPRVQACEPDVSRHREALQWIVRVADEQAAIRDEGAKNSRVELIRLRMEAVRVALVDRQLEFRVVRIFRSNIAYR
jgi:hypothetical protein